MPKMIGTVLPTQASIDATNKWHAAQERKRTQTASKLLAGLEHRRIDGEDRYYRDAKTFAIVSQRDHSVRWFEHRADGVYAVR